MAHEIPDQQPILIVGGTGKTGRRVANRLAARNLPVRIGSRSSEPPFDWEDRATWAPALHGVGSVYVTFYPDLAVPGSTDAIRAFTDLALGAGARRIVLLSGRGEEEAEACERILQSSDADWTILRSTWFAQNFSESYLVEPVLSGEVALPVGDVREPFVDADDIADVAVAALTEDGHVGQLYELTGPRLLTFAEAVEEIAEAAGRKVRFVQISPEEYGAALAAERLPSEVVELVVYLFTTVLDGRNAYLADGVQRALGRPPRDFADFAREAATAGVWNR
jgi:uncharacterized protein YbjT (DUF2867 family)